MESVGYCRVYYRPLLGKREKESHPRRARHARRGRRSMRGGAALARRGNTAVFSRSAKEGERLLFWFSHSLKRLSCFTIGHQGAEKGSYT